MEFWVGAALVNGVLAVVLLFLGDAVRALVRRVVAAGIGAVERRFSGSRWVRARSLRRYRDNISQRLSSVPVPFELPVDIPMRDVYIPLRAADQPEGSTADSPVDLAAAVGDRRRVLVLGPPGSGKSLFLRFLLWSSCTPSAGHGSERRRLAVAVPLSRLAETDDIHVEIAASFARHDFPAADDFVRRALTRGDLLVLFDGLDEVGSQRRPDVARLIADFTQRYPSLRFVVTCRTQVYSGALDGIVDKVLHVQPFSDDLVERFLRSWPAMSSPEAVDRLVNVLQHTPRVALLVRNPLLLTMLAYLYSSEYNESTGLLPHNRTHFYRDASELLLRRWQEKHNRFRWMDKKVVLQHLALVNQDSRADRRGIGYEAILAEIQAVLPRVNLSASEAKDVLDEIVDRSGLLMRLDGGERYQFAHLTMQEYFAAIELVDQPDEMFQRYLHDPESWREPVKLWCGGEQDSTDLIRGIAGADQVLALECLADATRVDGTYAEALIESMKAVLVEESTTREEGEAIAQAFGLLASDQRARGRAVLDYLVSHADCDGAAAALAVSNLPIAATAIGQQVATKHLMLRHLERMGDVAVPELVRLAMEESLDTARRATSSLAAVGTPRAAQALVSLMEHVVEAVSADSVSHGTILARLQYLGSGQGLFLDRSIAQHASIAKRAAVGLAQLTTSPAIVEALARTEASDVLSSLTAPTFDVLPASVWHPLFEQGHSSLRRRRLVEIFSLCHYLLDNLRDKDIGTLGRELDQRLVLAVLLFKNDGARRFATDTVHAAARVPGPRSARPGLPWSESVAMVGDKFQPWWLLLVRFLVRSRGITDDALKETTVAVVRDGPGYGDRDLQLVETSRSDLGIPVADLMDALGVHVRLVRQLRPDVMERLSEPGWSIERWWTAIPEAEAREGVA